MNRKRWIIFIIAFFCAGIVLLVSFRQEKPRTVKIRGMAEEPHAAIYEKIVKELPLEVARTLPVLSARVDIETPQFQNYLRYSSDQQQDFPYVWWHNRELLNRLSDKEFLPLFQNGQVWRDLGGCVNANPETDAVLWKRANAELFRMIEKDKCFPADAALGVMECVSGIGNGGLWSDEEFKTILAAIHASAENLFKTGMGYDSGASLVLFSSYFNGAKQYTEWRNRGLEILMASRTTASLADRIRAFPKLASALRLMQNQNTTIPPNLLKFVEKEAEQIMFLMETDGCVPQLDGVKQRWNGRAHLYRLGRLLGREDFLFAAYGGIKMGVLPSRITDLEDAETGWYVFRNSWNMGKFKDACQDNVLGANMFTVAVCAKTGDISISGERKPFAVIRRGRKLENVAVSREGNTVSFSANDGKFQLGIDKSTKQLTLKETGEGAIDWKIFFYRCELKEVGNNIKTQAWFPRTFFLPYQDDNFVRMHGELRVKHSGICTIQPNDGKLYGDRSMLMCYDGTFDAPPDDPEWMEGHFVKALVTGQNELSATFFILESLEPGIEPEGCGCK